MRLAAHDAVDTLYNFVKSCNRSKPHMEVLKHVVNILHNMSVYPETAQAIFNTTDAVDVFIELLQTYREVEHIFMTVANMLNLQCSYPDGQAVCLFCAVVGGALTFFSAYSARRPISRTRSASSSERRKMPRAA